MAFTQSWIIKAIDNFSNVTKNFSSEIEKNKKDIEGLGAALEKNYGKLLGASGAIFAGFGAATIAAGNLEAQLVRTFSIMKPEDVARFNKEINLAAEYAIKEGFAFDKVGDALLKLKRAQIDFNNFQPIMKQAVDLADATNSDLAITMQGLIGVYKSYGKENFNATQAANIFFGTYKEGGPAVDEFAMSLGAIAPTAKAMGLSFGETSAAMVTMMKKGVPLEQSIMALRSIFAGLRNPSKEAQETLNLLGITFGQEKIKAVGFGKVMEEIGKAYIKNNSALNLIFPNARAFAGIATLGAGAMKDYDAILKAVTGDTNSLNAALKMINKTGKETFDDLWGRLKLLTTDIGARFLPMAISAGQTLINILDKIQAMPDYFKRLIISATLLIGALMGVLGAIGAWKVFAVVLRGIGISTAGISVALGPIMLLITAVAMNMAVWKDWVTVISWLYEKFKALISLPFNLLIKPAEILGKLLGLNTKGGELAVKNTLAPFPAGMTNKTAFSADINLNAPKGVIQNATTKTTGFAFGKVGLNMAEARI